MITLNNVHSTQGGVMSLLSHLITCVLLVFSISAYSQNFSRNLDDVELVGADFVGQYSISISHFNNYAEYMSLIDDLKFMDVDIASIDWDDYKVDVLVTKTQELQLANLGFITINNKLKSNQRLQNNPSSRTTSISGINEVYLTYEEVTKEMFLLENNFPELISVREIGQSILGKPIFAMLLSTATIEDVDKYYKKPSIILDGLHHAREVLTPEVSLNFVKMTLDRIQNGDERAIDWVNKWNIWAVPMLNPDGSDIVWNKNSLWRKNAKTTDGRLHGVDMNRNYDYRFGDCRGSSSRKSSQTYRGESAFSEPETRALSDLAELILPAVYVSYHSYSELVIIPYGCEGEITLDHDYYVNLGTGFADNIKKINKDEGYLPGTGWEILYGVDGDSASYMYQRFGAASFVVEIGKRFHPRLDEIEPIMTSNMQGLEWLMDRISSDLLSVNVIDRLTKEPVLGRVILSRLNENGDVIESGRTSNEAPYMTNQKGLFFKVLGAGIYSVHIETERGVSQAQSFRVIEGQPTNLTFAL